MSQYPFAIRSFFGLAAAAFAGVVLSVQAAGAQSAGADPVAVSPDHYRVLLENEHVRVLNVTIAPGERDEMHSHPANVYFVLSGEKMKFHLPDDKEREGTLRRGAVTIQDPIEMHSVENTGEAPLNLIMIERKGADAPERKGEDPTRNSRSMYKVVMEDDVFRVIDVNVKAGEQDKPHGHPAAVIYSLSQGTGTVVGKEGQSEERTFSRGRVTFQDAVEEHSLQNTGSTPIHLLMFELKD